MQEGNKSIINIIENKDNTREVKKCKLDKSAWLCPLCYEDDVLIGCITKCEHYFCFLCWIKFTKNDLEYNCPMCRAKANVQSTRLEPRQRNSGGVFPEIFTTGILAKSTIKNLTSPGVKVTHAIQYAFCLVVYSENDEYIGEIMRDACNVLYTNDLTQVFSRFQNFENGDYHLKVLILAFTTVLICQLGITKTPENMLKALKVVEINATQSGHTKPQFNNGDYFSVNGHLHHVSDYHNVQSIIENTTPDEDMSLIYALTPRATKIAARAILAVICKKTHAQHETFLRDILKQTTPEKCNALLIHLIRIYVSGTANDELVFHQLLIALLYIGPGIKLDGIKRGQSFIARLIVHGCFHQNIRVRYLSIHFANLYEPIHCRASELIIQLLKNSQWELINSFSEDILPFFDGKLARMILMDLDKHTPEKYIELFCAFVAFNFIGTPCVCMLSQSCTSNTRIRDSEISFNDNQACRIYHQRSVFEDVSVIEKSIWHLSSALYNRIIAQGIFCELLDLGLENPSSKVDGFKAGNAFMLALKKLALNCNNRDVFRFTCIKLAYHPPLCKLIEHPMSELDKLQEKKTLGNTFALHMGIFECFPDVDYLSTNQPYNLEFASSLLNGLLSMYGSRGMDGCMYSLVNNTLNQFALRTRGFENGGEFKFPFMALDYGRIFLHKPQLCLNIALSIPNARFVINSNDFSWFGCVDINFCGSTFYKTPLPLVTWRPFKQVIIQTCKQLLLRERITKQIVSLEVLGAIVQSTDEICDAIKIVGCIFYLYSAYDVTNFIMLLIRRCMDIYELTGETGAMGELAEFVLKIESCDGAVMLLGTHDFFVKYKSNLGATLQWVCRQKKMEITGNLFKQTHLNDNYTRVVMPLYRKMSGIDMFMLCIEFNSEFAQHMVGAINQEDVLKKMALQMHHYVGKVCPFLKAQLTLKYFKIYEPSLDAFKTLISLCEDFDLFVKMFYKIVKRIKSLPYEFHVRVSLLEKLSKLNLADPVCIETCLKLYYKLLDQPNMEIDVFKQKTLEFGLANDNIGFITLLLHTMVLDDVIKILHSGDVEKLTFFLCSVHLDNFMYKKHMTTVVKWRDELISIIGVEGKQRLLINTLESGNATAFWNALDGGIDVSIVASARPFIWDFCIDSINTTPRSKIPEVSRGTTCQEVFCRGAISIPLDKFTAIMGVMQKCIENLLASRKMGIMDFYKFIVLNSRLVRSEFNIPKTDSCACNISTSNGGIHISTPREVVLHGPGELLENVKLDILKRVCEISHASVFWHVLGQMKIELHTRNPLLGVIVKWFLEMKKMQHMMILMQNKSIYMKVLEIIWSSGLPQSYEFLNLFYTGSVVRDMCPMVIQYIDSGLAPTDYMCWVFEKANPPTTFVSNIVHGDGGVLPEQTVSKLSMLAQFKLSDYLTHLCWPLYYTLHLIGKEPSLVECANPWNSTFKGIAAGKNISLFPGNGSIVEGRIMGALIRNFYHEHNNYMRYEKIEHISKILQEGSESYILGFIQTSLPTDDELHQNNGICKYVSFLGNLHPSLENTIPFVNVHNFKCTRCRG